MGRNSACQNWVHQLPKGHNFGTGSASKLKKPIKKENLSPHFHETYTSIHKHLKMSKLLAETLRLTSYTPKNFTHAFACPRINNGLSPPYLQCSANHAKAKRRLSVSLRRQSICWSHFHCFQHSVSQWIGNQGRNVDRNMIKWSEVCQDWQNNTMQCPVW